MSNVFFFFASRYDKMTRSYPFAKIAQIIMCSQNNIIDSFQLSKGKCFRQKVLRNRRGCQLLSEYRIRTFDNLGMIKSKNWKLF